MRRLLPLMLVMSWMSACLSAGCAPHSREVWSAVQVPTDAAFAGLSFVDSLNGWVGGGGHAVEGGIIGRTRDGGHTWKFTSGVLPYLVAGFGLHRIQFRDTLTGWAAADGGLVLGTDDGGLTWKPKNTNMNSGSLLLDVCVLEGEHGWAAGPGGVIGTTDGGEIWTTLLRSQSENGYLSANAIQFVDSRRGWVVTHGGQLMASTDGGQSWTAVPLPRPANPQLPLWGLCFVDAEHGWVVGAEGTILHTEDGSTWRRQSEGVPIVRLGPDGKPAQTRDVLPELETPADHLTLTAVQFADRERGWAVGYYADVALSVVLGTEDGGEHWHVEYELEGELLRTLDALDAHHAWAAGDRARKNAQVILRFGRRSR